MDHRPVVHRQQGHRDQPPRPKPQAALQPGLHQVHLAVAAKAGGAHRHRLDHGAETADAGALRVDLGQAVAQQRHVRCGAADVADQRILRARQPARPHDAGGGAGQDGLDRPFPHHRGRDQRPVAAHHHQRRVDAHGLQMAFAGRNQAVDHSDQPGVQHRRQRPLRAVQLGRKLVAAGDGAAGHAADHLARGDFMGGVAGGKAGGNGKAHHLRPQFGHLRLKRGQVQRRGLGARVGVAAVQKDDRVTLQRLGQAAALHVAGVEADEDQRDAAALPLDQRIGGQRGGQRHQVDVRRPHPRRRQRRIHRAADAHRQVGPRGQGLRLAQDAVRGLVQDHGIRIGAARVHAQKEGHSVPPFCHSRCET